MTETDLEPSGYAGPTRGEATEMVAERFKTAGSEDEAQRYRILLHFIGCNLLTKEDLFGVLGPGVMSENLAHLLAEASADAEELDGEDYLVCPNCEETVRCQAQQFTADETTTDSE